MKFPNKVKMSGLPFMFQGWNNIFTKTDELSEDCPIYVLSEYTLYSLIEIIGVNLLKKDGKWRLQRSCDSSYFFTKISDEDSPIGTWEYGGRVTEALDNTHVREWLPNIFY